MTCSSLETALQASKVQDDLMASQLRAAQHLLQCEKLETQALSQQVSLSAAAPVQETYARRNVSVPWGACQGSPRS